ncbi:hypothetical protein ANRL1_02859 [Anaerolineae bacterium]|nr:hypothetical protein ANRL1_02859 [Anaerolineae bacterium]
MMPSLIIAKTNAQKRRADPKRLEKSCGRCEIRYEPSNPRVPGKDICTWCEEELANGGRQCNGDYSKFAGGWLQTRPMIEPGTERIRADEKTKKCKCGCGKQIAIYSKTCRSGAMKRHWRLIGNDATRLTRHTKSR